MNLLIVVDMEGISCIGHDNSEWIRCNTHEWNEYGRKEMTKDVEVIVEECLRFGVEAITICDAHDKGNSLLKERFDKENIKLVSQLVNVNFQEVRYDYAILVGFHAKLGNLGVFPHTYRPDINKIMINNEIAGEVAIIMSLLGEKNIPTIMVTGDYHGVEEAKEKVPNCVGGVVKWHKNNEISLLTRDKANKVLRESTMKALNKRESIPLIKTSYPLSIDIELGIIDYIEGLKQKSIEYNYSDSTLTRTFNTYDQFNLEFSKLCGILNSEMSKVFNVNVEFVRYIKKTYPRLDSIQEKISGKIGEILSKRWYLMSSGDRDKLERIIKENYSF